jgi:phosphoglycolate phosphatase
MLMIGDSGTDAQAARAAGCPVFCVTYGYNEGRDVRELDTDAIVESLVDATRLIEKA